MAMIKAEIAKKIREEITKKKLAPKTIEEIYEIMAKNTEYALDGKRWDSKKNALVDSERKKNVLLYHEKTKNWLLFVSYGNELAYAHDIKADKNDIERAKMMAKNHLNDLSMGNIGSGEKAEILKVVNAARDRGKKLAAGKKS